MASEKVMAIVEELKTLTVLELSELVKAVEDEFGVSAAAAVAVAAPVEAAAAAEVFPVEAQITALAPASFAFVTAIVIPRSLKLPVGFEPSNFK